MDTETSGAKLLKDCPSAASCRDSHPACTSAAGTGERSEDPSDSEGLSEVEGCLTEQPLIHQTLNCTSITLPFDLSAARLRSLRLRAFGTPLRVNSHPEKCSRRTA
ncbi:MAG: hypothetical protein AB1345_14520 [Chloroflexota bacterium]